MLFPAIPGRNICFIRQYLTPHYHHQIHYYLESLRAGKEMGPSLLSSSYISCLFEFFYHKYLQFNKHRSNNIIWPYIRGKFHGRQDTDIPMALTVSARDSYILECPLGIRPHFKHFASTSSFNPHDTSVKWLLVTSHFTDEETGAQRDSLVTHPLYSRTRESGRLQSQKPPDQVAS